MVKIVHCSDIHFDSPFGLPDAGKAEIRRLELRESFLGMLAFAKEKQADLILITGDLFDRRNISRSTVSFLKEAFASIPETEIIIGPGNHDFYSDDSIYARVGFSENVHVFRSEELSSFSFDFDKRRVNIYGYAYTAPSMYGCPFEKFRVVEPSALNILMAHGSLNGDNPSDGPFTIEKLTKTGIDYAALGHIHANPGLHDEGDMWYGYSGTLEPFSFDDCGERGFIYLEADKDAGDFICKPSFIKASKRFYACEEVKVTGALGAEDIIGAFTAMLGRHPEYGERTLLRTVLTGDVDPAAVIPEEEIERAAMNAGIFSFELEDLTLPLYNSEYLASDPTIRGALFNAFRPMICSEDRGEASRATAAFRAGFAALNKKADTESAQ